MNGIKVRTWLIAITAFILGIILSVVWIRIARIQSHSEDVHIATTAVVQQGDSALNKAEHDACVAHQMLNDACRTYRVTSYDATWRNNSGNEGQFQLERDGLRIRAFCGVENCYRWIDAVGNSVEADDSITNLITYHLPDCEDPLYVKNALERYKQMTGRNATVGNVCQQTLVVEKIEAK